MTNEILINILDRVKRACECNAKQLQKNYYVARNGCVLGDFVTTTLLQMIKREKNFVFTDESVWTNDQCFEETACNAIVNNNICSLPHNTCTVFTLNCLDSRFEDFSERQKVIDNFRLCCERFSAKGLVVACIIVPQPEVCPEGVTALAEREYDFYLQTKDELTWSESFYLQIENVMRDACCTDKSRLIMLRYTNILGPLCYELMQGIDLKEILLTTKKTQTIFLVDSDPCTSFTYITLNTALYAILLSVANPRRLLGHILNVSTKKATILDMKWALYRAYQNEVTLIGSVLNKHTSKYCGLNSLYFSGLFPNIKKEEPTLEEALYQIGCFEFERSYDIMRKLKVYEGRLPMIRNTEMEMLKIIDEICRKNGIQYFLAGGTALGAVRHQDMIPWDDDIDIGMLREDYEKFRKIVPALLPETMTYEASNSTTGSHYHFDKIRLKETWFSTKYSSNFNIPDGVFIDILVYDNTSNYRLFQKVHIRLTSMWTRVLNVKWVNKPRKNVHYKASVLALPIMRCISWKWFHHVFERIVRMYENKKDARYVIDSVGLNIKKGALQRSWMTEVEYVQFGDLSAPVPKSYDKYLKHFYGQNYMNMLPLDRRVSGHKIARLDLGEKLFNNEISVFALNIKGMLRENRKEEI